MDAKTPVTLLNEFLLKNNQTPDYVLVHNGVGTHDPLFIYEVSGLGKTAVGEGKSKREAKHAAARELLLMISGSEKKLEGIVQSPYADVFKENAIGALQDFCSMYSINMPIYEQVRDEGLPHAKLFGIKCMVSTLSTHAEARTKKQAKQMAAQQMLDKLNECLKDDRILEFASVKTKSEIMEENEQRGIDKLEDYYKKHDIKPTQTRPLGTPLDHYDKIFKQDIYLCSEAFNRIKSMRKAYFETLDDPMALLLEVTGELNLTVVKSQLPTEEGVKNKLFALTVPELNDATFLGLESDETSAVRAACVSALNWLSVMGS